MAEPYPQLNLDPEMYALQTAFLSGAMPEYYNTGLNPNWLSPELDPLIQYQLATGMEANTDKYGDLLPYNMDYQKDALNFQQDVYGSLADNINTYLAGPDAYAPGTLDQIADETPFPVQSLPLLQSLAASGGVRGTLAEFIMAGDNDLTAVNRLKRALNDPKSAGLTDAQVEQLRAELPPMINMNGLDGPEEIPGQYDWQAIQKDANSLWQPFATEKAQLDAGVAAGNIIERDGQYFNVEYSDSPQMEWLKKMGLPDPRAVYDAEWALKNDPAVRGAFDRMESSKAGRDASRKLFDEYTKKLTKQREQMTQARQADRDAMDRFSRDMQNSFQDYTSQMGQMTRYRRPDEARQYPLDQPGAPLPGDPAIVEQLQLQAHPASPTATGTTYSQLMPGIIESTNKQMEAMGAEPLPVPEMPGTPVIKPIWHQPDKPQQSIWSGRTEEEAIDFGNAALEMADKLPGFKVSQRFADPRDRKKMIAAQKALAKAAIGSGESYIDQMMPYLAMQVRGRTPRTDAIQQRLLPLYTSGAFGQQGMPTAYPNFNS